MLCYKQKIFSHNCRDIAAGEEVSDSYGMSYIETPLAVRQRRLLQQYKLVAHGEIYLCITKNMCRFRCGCVACSRRYPVYRDLASLVPDAAAAELSLGLDTARRSVARGELGPARAQLLQLLQRLGQHHQAGHTLTHAVSR